MNTKREVHSDSHGCLACSHPVQGPAVQGSPNVLTNGMPALRVGDAGIHSACCGNNTWKAAKGSATVFINGIAAHRMGDKTAHCGGNGHLIEGSSNVFIGDGTSAGALAGAGTNAGVSRGAGSDSEASPAEKSQTMIFVQAQKGSAPFCEICQESDATVYARETPATSESVSFHKESRALAPKIPKAETAVTKEVAELIFVLNDANIGAEKILFLSKTESDELKKEEEYWDNLAKNLKEADRNGKGKDGDIAGAKEEIATALTGFVDGSKGASQFTEIRRLAGKKTTYVRSDKIKNHWRKYSLSTDDKKNSLRSEKNGKLDDKKIKKQFSKVLTEIKIEKKKEINTTIGGSESDFGKYIDDINRSLQWSLNKKGADPEKIHFDTGASAQLMRFYAGASVSGSWDPANRVFGIDASVNASIALAEGKISSTAYWPDKAGFHATFQFKGKMIDLGSIRAYLELSATGFAGASASGSLAIKISPDDAKGMLGFAGAEPGSDKKPEDSPPAMASGKLFAGVEAGGEVTGALAWDNPEERKDNPEEGKKSQPAWKDFFKIGYAATVAAGIGAEAEFKIGFIKNKFIFKAKAGIVIGLGASGSVTGILDAGAIWNFVQFVYHKLKDVDFHFLDILTPDAFEAVTQLMVWAIEAGEEIKEFGEQVYETLEDKWEAVQGWWLARKKAEKKAENLADKILKNPESLKFTTPEAKGIMLFTLTENPGLSDVTFMDEKLKKQSSRFFPGFKASMIIRMCASI